ncbi:MAG: ABC transporter ATP-binding protein [Archangium sp.]|nr:ABC transporter ATP-binding protein [Archangium sp.]
MKRTTTLPGEEVTLSVKGLGVVLDGHALVDDFSLKLQAGRVHAVVGESGSGKTLSALAVLGLLPEGATTRGSASKGGVELLTAAVPLRREGLAMVLQEPLSALNPVLSVGAQLMETLSVHGARGELRALAVALLEEVGIPAGEDRLRLYPHQLSGGQRQRVSIACALAASPEVLIADEPTTALDASMRGVILSLLRRLARERALAVWLITHDLQAVRGASDEVTVMYAGRVVEQGLTEQVLESPRHPYTAGLLRSNPAGSKPGAPLPALPGSVPLASEVIPGCRFHPRCPRVFDRCWVERPALLTGAACHLVNP